MKIRKRKCSPKSLKNETILRENAFFTEGGCHFAANSATSW